MGIQPHDHALDAPQDSRQAAARAAAREELRERIALERRVAELEAQVEERDRALRVERRRARALRRASTELVEASRRERELAEEHARELSRVRVRVREVERERRELADTVGELQARQSELTGERETVHAALAAARQAVEALDEQLRAAGRVQRISRFIGDLTFPKGAEELRTGRPDHPLYETLLQAQSALKERWLELIDLREQLGEVQAAVEDRAEGEAFRQARVAALQEELDAAQARSRELRRTCREQEESLEQLQARESEQATRAERVRELEQRLASAQRVARGTTRRLERETLARRLEQRDALKALAAAERRIEELQQQR